MPKKTKKRQREEKVDLLIERAISCLENGTAVSKRNEKPKDSDDVFGQFVASELQQITDLKLKQLIKWKIQNALFEGTISMQQDHLLGFPHGQLPPVTHIRQPRKLQCIQHIPRLHFIWDKSGSNTETESVI